MSTAPNTHNLVEVCRADFLKGSYKRASNIGPERDKEYGPMKQGEK